MSTTRVLVVGSSRSGSIWTARMLAATPGGRFMVEPDNVNTDRTATSSDFGPFPVLTPGQPSPEYAALWQLAFAGRVPGRRGWLHPLGQAVLHLPAPLRGPLLWSAAGVMGSLPTADTVVVQTVMAHFAVEWIVDRFHPQVVIIQRDPLNMLSSWLEWNVHGFDLDTRPEVRTRCAELGIDVPPIGTSDVSRTAWWIGLLTSVLGAVAAGHPEWTVVTHEDLCAEPQARFQELYAHLGLTWTDASVRFLEETGYLVPKGRTHHGRGPSTGDAAAVRGQVAQRWRDRMSAEDVEEARQVLKRFPTSGWVVPPAESLGIGHAV
jgi:hypothetical protein